MAAGYPQIDVGQIASVVSDYTDIFSKDLIFSKECGA